MQVLVIHVWGNEDRRLFIEKQLSGLGMPVEYILDGNKEDLTDEVLDKYFAGEMHGQFPNTHCAYKHLLSCRYIVEHDLEGALVVEDNLRIFKGFKQKFEESMEECRREHADEPLIINYEESSLLLVPRSQRRKGKMLYKAERDRFAGCMYVSRRAAEAIMEYVEKHKSEHTSDRLHTLLIQKGLLTYYWSYPCLACQCSCDGSMPTMIPTRPRPYKRLKWFYKRFYKHLLYWFR